MKKMNINELIPADYNPRIDLKNGDPEFEALKATIKEFGFVQPVVWNKRSGVVVGGHQRIKAAKELGYAELPVEVVDLDATDEKRLNLALNKVSGKWDEEILGALLSELQMDGADLTNLGFDEIEIEELTMGFADVQLPDMDEDSGNEPSADGDEYDGIDSEDGRGYVIQYNIIFDNEEQQDSWHSFLKMLKKRYDNDVYPTIASRLQAFFEEEGLGKGNTPEGAEN